MDRILPANARLIPDNADCVYSGEIFDVYQWPEKLYDGSPATFEMLKRPDTVKIIAVKDDKMIVIEETQPSKGHCVTFPGGRVDKTDNDWLTAAKREMLEETGLSFKNWKLIEVVQPILKIEWFVAWYVAFDLLGSEKPKNDNGEKISVHTCSIDECFREVFNENNPESKYLPYSIKASVTLNELINIKAYDGRNFD
jgi:ADP-ribose pyrophosphatase